GEADRRKYETEFLRRSEDRDRRAQRVAARGGPDLTPNGVTPAAPAIGTDTPQGEGGAATGAPADGQTPTVEQDQGVDGLLKQVREPQFISSSYFLRFKFEAGKYALVGREMLDGNEVLRIEYYPANLYSDGQR